MGSLASVAFARQDRLVAVADTARARALHAWEGMDFANLDASWASIVGPITAQVSAAQLTMARGSDRFTAQVAGASDYTPERSSVIAEAFVGVDGGGRSVDGILRGSVTTTKEAIGAGLGRVQALDAGAAYLAAIMKTVIGDMSRSADLTSGAGKGFTHYIRVVNGGACSRCAILAGISSGQTAFKRHISCQCTAAPSLASGKAPAGLHATPEEYFNSLSAVEQDRVFTKAGAEAIRSGADVSRVVSARRGAKGIGYSSRGGSRAATEVRGHFQKTTIGYRSNGQPVQVYTTSDGATKRGFWGSESQGRARLMPESIMDIAGDDLPLRQAFLRDAGYLDYVPPKGVGYSNEWITQGLPAQKAADRLLVNRATLKFDNFTLG